MPAYIKHGILWTQLFTPTETLTRVPKLEQAATVPDGIKYFKPHVGIFFLHVCPPQEQIPFIPEESALPAALVGLF